VDKKTYITKQIFVDDLVEKFPESRRFFGRIGLCITGVGAISLEQLLVEMNKKNIDNTITELNDFIEHIRSKEM
jgi:hypothetical protein